MFIHDDPLWWISCGFGGDYPGSAAALINSPAPQLTRSVVHYESTPGERQIE
ncbi:hypothetical protein D1BOALGB6SA_10143 [Olavius sp. associated proteobacterium Delta 1]|nr:hypothetical protein D1BOALGB6SA_10143 [Olavius sp. associated proteobacterium Delta 1]